LTSAREPGTAALLTADRLLELRRRGDRRRLALSRPAKTSNSVIQAR
jgi:hypothetical protein